MGGFPTEGFLFSSTANNKIKTALYVDDTDHLTQNIKGKNSKPGNQNLGKKVIITSRDCSPGVRHYPR